MTRTHLYDLSLGGGRRRPACDEVSDCIEIGESFDKLKAGQKCEKCVAERALAIAWERTCRVCSKAFESGKALCDHTDSHLLSAASYRKDPLAFVLRMQSFYDDSHSKARALGKAYAELREFHPTLQFETVPSRLELTKEGKNGVMLGDAHVVDYLLVQK